jgi:hypothetical protein
MQELSRWLNGWVYAAFGAEGLLAFQAHPLLYAALALALALVVLAILCRWLSRRIAHLRRSVRTTLRLAASSRGRECLRLARGIRRGGASLRHAIRQEIEERGERRALLQALTRFTRAELHGVLEHAVRLLAHADDARERALRSELEQQQQAWSASRDEGERERLQHASAATRQQLAVVSAANAARTEHLRGLQEAAQAVRALEQELGELHRTRSRALPAFRDHLTQVARRMSDLKEAYRELDPPR